MPIEPERCAVWVRGVEHGFGGVVALYGVDLELRFGELAVLVGPNGAGKTTLLRILAGILPPSAGEVSVLGASAPSRFSRCELRRRVGYVAQDPALDPEMSGREILDLFATLYGLGRAERRRRVEALGAAFGVAAHLKKRVEQLSGGLRRRLHLAAGMIHDPELLLLDEPTTGLDAQGQQFLWAELVRRARAGRAVVVVSHDQEAVGHHAERVVRLEAGRVVSDAPP